MRETFGSPRRVLGILLATTAGSVFQCGSMETRSWDLRWPCSPPIPAYRGQGVYERLAWSALQDAKQNGIGVSFGFPNELSYPGSLKHGWMDLGRVKDLVWVVNAKDFLRRMQRNRVTKVFVSVLLPFAAPRLDGTEGSGHPRPGSDPRVHGGCKDSLGHAETPVRPRHRTNQGLLGMAVSSNLGRLSGIERGKRGADTRLRRVSNRPRERARVYL